MDSSAKVMKGLSSLMKSVICQSLSRETFLRVLQERRFRPVGGAKEVVSDFRLMAATHRDLELLVEKDQFRSDSSSPAGPVLSLISLRCGNARSI